MSYMSSPFSPYLGALELQFALGPFYKFVALSLMVLYQLESIHLDDNNLIQGFYQFLTVFPLKDPTFSFFYNHSSKPTWNLPKTTPPHLYWWFKTSYNQTLGKNPKNSYQGPPIHTKPYNYDDSMFILHQLGFFPTKLQEL